MFSTGGDNSEGLLYLSRMNVADDPKKKDEEAREKLRLAKEKENNMLLAKGDDMNDRKLSKSIEVKNLHLRDKKRRFAISLATLASKPQKRQDIVKQGCIETLVNLAKLQDRQTQLSCAAAFNSLACEPTIRKIMLKEGAVPSIVSLSLSPLRKIKNDCARALCNLAVSPGDEEELVRQGVVQSLLQVSTSSIQLMEVVLMALLNLSCVDERYGRIDEVNKGNLISLFFWSIGS